MLIVAGGGIIGLSCAWRLRARGHDVTVFDARETGAEASWAGAGMLAPGGEAGDSEAHARMSVAALTQYPAFIDELREVSGRDIEFLPCGALEVATDEAEAAALQARGAHQSAWGIRSETVQFRDFTAARFFPDEAVVHPRELMAALKIACERTGVTIREHEAIATIAGGGRSVRTVRTSYSCDGVVIAAGAWSSRIVPVLPAAALARSTPPQTMPVRGHLIRFERGAARLDHILRRGPTYLLTRRGSVVAGSSTEHVGFERAIDPAIAEDIRARASDLLPELTTLRPVDVWNGFRPGIEACMPCIGRIAGTSIWAAFGHYRNGILLAPETARVIAASLETDSLVLPGTPQ